jgi:hypothetical protein
LFSCFVGAWWLGGASRGAATEQDEAVLLWWWLRKQAGPVLLCECRGQGNYQRQQVSSSFAGEATENLGWEMDREVSPQGKTTASERDLWVG